METVVIDKLVVYKISTGELSSVTVWQLGNGMQPTLFKTLGQNQELVVGPYLNIVSFGLEKQGIVSVEKVFSDFSHPVKLLDYIGTNVVNLTPGEDVVVNAGNVLNQRIGYKDDTSGCGSSPVTLISNGCTIDGSTSYILNTDGVYVELIWDGESNWRIG